MNFPERFSDLPAYAFPRLRTLLDGRSPGGDHVRAGGTPVPMTIGEPQHAFPDWVGDEIAANLAGFNRYPPNQGSDALLTAIGGWIGSRYGVTVDPARQVVALNGTREGLYNALMALSPETRGGKTPNVLISNPFYQCYMVAALSVGARPVFVNATAETGFLPDFAALSPEVLDATTVAYICSPSNPQGAVASAAYWRDLIALAEKHDFRIFADECYSEIWRDSAPVGALQIAQDAGADPERVAIFHSLSKRSNLPGLRSGFMASGPGNIAAMNTLKNYAGAPLPMPLQAVAARAWGDEAHVAENRALYQEKYRLADRILGPVLDDLLGYSAPAAGFFLWLPVDDGEAATIRLWEEAGVHVLPGAYLSQETDAGNPGAHYIRAAMVAPAQDVQRGLTLLRDCLYPG